MPPQPRRTSKPRSSLVGLLIAGAIVGCAPGLLEPRSGSHPELYREGDDANYQCMAVVSDVGILTAAHCAEGEAPLHLVDTNGNEWIAERETTVGNIAVLSSEIPAQALPVDSPEDEANVRARTRQGWVRGEIYLGDQNDVDADPEIAGFSAAPGDSGGAVVNEAGRLVGLIVGANDIGSTLYVPIPEQIQSP